MPQFMLKTLVVFFILFPFSLFAQKSIEKTIKKLGIEKSDIAYTDERLLLYPRGFIYSVSAPDSAYYFSCFASDSKNIESYFDNSSTKKLPVKHIVIRGSEDYADTIKIEALDDKIKHFKSADAQSSFTINKDTEYVIIYYWNKQMLDRKFISNIKFIKEYSRNNPEKKIQIIIADTGKYR